MNPIKIARALRVVDYTVGIATLGYGLVTVQPLFIGFGVAGLALAHLNFSDKVSQALRNYFGRKSQVTTRPPPTLEVPLREQPTPASGRASYGESHLQVGPTLTSWSKHSLLKSEAHLDHAVTEHPLR